MANKVKGKKDFKWGIDEDEKPVKIDKWDGAAVKNALDDAAKKVLLSEDNFVEDTKLMDGRLLICTISVGFALFALVWDYMHPFPESRPVLITCVLLYFVMMGVLTVYTSFVEKGCFLSALEKDQAGLDPPNIWTLSSKLKRYDDQYSLELSFQDGSNTKEFRQAEIDKCVSQYFDEEGLICQEKFIDEVKKLHTSLKADKKQK